MSIRDTLQSFIALIFRHEIRSGATDDALERLTTESWITAQIDARDAGREVRRRHPGDADGGEEGLFETAGSEGGRGAGGSPVGRFCRWKRIPGTGSQAERDREMGEPFHR